MSHPKPADLDRPIWEALTTRHAHLALGDTLVRRYHPDVAPFAALATATPDAYDALHRLLQPGQQVALLSTEPLPSYDALQITRVGILHQMVANIRKAPKATSVEKLDVIRLTQADNDDMLDLAGRTRPGPFSVRTRETGNYIGVRDNGRLIAMAGERLHLDGHVEISAVCVDETHRGRGLAGRLMQILQREIEARAETPFLHVFSDNLAAIGLYERLGFELRRAFHLARVEHAASRESI
ncbi:GNAT family N-acetyltransferase [Caballeronia sp. HLA56]